MDWSFLDKMDRNLLYLYTRDLMKGGRQVHFMQLYSPEDTGHEETNDFLRAEMKRKTAYYLIWVVYRYILECRTYEQAVRKADIETLRKYKLGSLFGRRHIYLGVYNTENEIKLWRENELELRIALNILYNRLGFFEQLECYMNMTSKKTRARAARVLENVANDYKQIQNT